MVHINPATMIMMLVGVNALGVVALWLRLRWRARQEQARNAFLLALADALPTGSEFDEQRSDGGWVKLSRGEGGDHG